MMEVPSDLPRPEDDGAADNLTGMKFPEITLKSTSGESVNTSSLTQGITVIYCYPKTGRPDEEMPKGWDDIPGARGCTVQALDFSKKYNEFERRGVQVFGMSTQTTDYQKEMVNRLQVPFPILCDTNFTLTKLLKLPTFEVAGEVLLKRLTMIIKDGIIVKVFYPVFPPNEDAGEVLAWLDRESNSPR